MEPTDVGALPGARQLRAALLALGEVMPPDHLRPAVLTRLGLIDSYWRLETPIGTVYVAENREGVSAVQRAEADATFERAFRDRFGRPAYPAAAPPPVARAVERLLAGDKGARPRIDLRGLTVFEREVLEKAREIPRGEVRPYGWVAREIGRPGATRAVGTALGRNPVPLLIPCHRVVRGDGRLGDYVFGREAKRALLAAEGTAPEELEGLARSGIRYVGSDTTRIFCHPTCRNARRITERHRVPFPNAAAATVAGYRPCQVCRPA